MLDWFANHTAAAVTCTAAFLAIALPLNKTANPFSLFELICFRLAERLYKPSYSNKYQYFAASFAALLWISCACIVILGVLQFAEYPWFFDAIILYLCLHYPFGRSSLNRISRYLQSGQKRAAKEVLQPYVRRNTAKLSDVGIVKATIEAQLLRYYRLFLLPLTLYYVFSIEVMFVVHLLQITQMQFSKLAGPNSAFAKPLGWVNYWLEWLPVRLLSLPLLVSQLKRASILQKHYLPNALYGNSYWLLCIASAHLQHQLCGPVYYGEQRHNKARISDNPLPTINTISKTAHLVRYSSFFWLLFMILLEVLHAFVSRY